ncbi:hypothetical protein QLQ12_41100 [Actinoplanes sp. NEAU-A12]|uniref:Uncharacterized protein n=1 Tax=Actinoplanes sandaracinus TaxID=3045177 RepID=A0ABT6WZ20_9ACTN|nr:hypothetical protein [Actinoplanes sandaracinus]MDI6105002.1 hypothetical protein [Actinoplanes sandaracinus]
MGIQELGSQSARTDTGVVLRSVDRETLRADFRDRSMLVAVDGGLTSYGVYLPRVPTWDDGDPVPEEDLAVIKEAVVEILRHWGFATEFITLNGG